MRSWRGLGKSRWAALIAILAISVSKPGVALSGEAPTPQQPSETTIRFCNREIATLRGTIAGGELQGKARASVEK